MKTINTSYGVKCDIYTVKEESSPLLVIDFNIKEYKVCDFGWTDYKFPTDIVINDKLYLDKKLTIQVVELLDCFIQTRGLEAADSQTTERGFYYRDLQDLKGNKISIQESSNGMDAFIWFGCVTDDKVFVKKDNQLIPYKFPKGDCLVEDRLHLNIDQAKELKLVLIDYIENITI